MLVTVPTGSRGRTTVEGVPVLDGVIGRIDLGELAVVGIDIPIGLPESDARRCDVEARLLLGPRRSSVFPAPLRGLLGATSYEDAARRCRALSGKGLSRQAFGILGKVGEVDSAMSPERQRCLVEVHPEVSFTALAGTPMVHYKKTPEGRAERLEVLRPVFRDVERQLGARLEGVGADDVLDAFAVAWSARRWLARSHLQLGGERDRRDLRMEIIA